MKTLEISKCKQVRFNLKLREIHSPESAAPQAETLQSRSRSKLLVLGFGFSQPYSFPKACRDIQMSQKGKQNWEHYSCICPVWNQTWHGDMDEHLPWTVFNNNNKKNNKNSTKQKNEMHLGSFLKNFLRPRTPAGSVWCCGSRETNTHHNPPI